MSNSEENTKSGASSDTDGSSSCASLTVVAEYDDLIRLVKQRRCDDVYFKFLEFIEQTKNLNMHLQTSASECERLQAELAKVTHDFGELECKLGLARKMLDQEKKKTRRIEEERNSLDRMIDSAAQFLFNKQNRLPSNVLRELAYLQREHAVRLDNGCMGELSALQEVNTTGSFISDFSYSQSEDDLEVSTAFSNEFSSSMKSQRRSSEFLPEPPVKKRRSTSSKTVEINTTDTVRATTTLTVCKDGPITATSIIESVPQEAAKKNPFEPSAAPVHLLCMNNNNIGTNSNLRQHAFQTKIVVIPETCGSCNKRIKFGRYVCRCQNCRFSCHRECKDLLQLPCIPTVNTPQKGSMGTISDYTPSVSPMVPPLIVHCTREVESRGCNELGIYRVPGSEKEVKSLKEKFLKGKCSPSIKQTDVHVICGTIKDFLRSLQEPLVTNSRRADMIKAVEMLDANEVAPVLNQIISELPEPNRDTLAYMILHLKRVSTMPLCKMTADNLAKIFGPTIVGYSSPDCNADQLLTETRQQYMVMNQLMNLPVDFWEPFLESNGEFKTPTGKLQQTPSTDSLLYPKSKRIFSPNGVRSTGKRKQKFFPSPDGFM